MHFRAVVFATMLAAPGLAAAQMPLPSLEPAPPRPAGSMSEPGQESIGC